MSPARALPIALVLCGCSANSEYGIGASGAGTGHKTTGATGSAGATAGASSGAASTGGMASTGGSTGGSSGSTNAGGTTGASCDATWQANWDCGGYLPAPGECAPSQVELKGRITNVCGGLGADGAPPITEAFTVADAFDARVAATTAPCGVYWFCVDAGTEITPVFNAAGYYPYEIGTLKLDVSSSFTGAVTNPEGLELFCTYALQDVVGLEPPIDLSQAFVVVGNPGGNDGTACDDNSGWTYALSQLDGGALNPPYAFLVGADFAQSDGGGTSGEGIQFIYNLNPSLGAVKIRGTKLGNQLPDGGERCPDLSTEAPLWPYTGVIPIASATMSFFYYVVE